MRERRSAAESDALPQSGAKNNEFQQLSLRRNRVEVQRYDPSKLSRTDKYQTGGRKRGGGSAPSPLEAAAAAGNGGAQGGQFDVSSSSGPSPSAIGPDPLQSSNSNGGAGPQTGGPRRGKSAGVAGMFVPTVHNSVTGLQQILRHVEPDVPQLASRAANYRRGISADVQTSGNVKGKKAKAAAEARDRDTQATKSWRPEGRMVGHLSEHKGAVNKLIVSPDQRFFASASDDGSVRIWECGRLEGRGVTNESRQQFTKQGGRIKHIDIGEGGQVILALIGRSLSATNNFLWRRRALCLRLTKAVFS